MTVCNALPFLALSAAAQPLTLPPVEGQKSCCIHHEQLLAIRRKDTDEPIFDSHNANIYIRSCQKAGGGSCCGSAAEGLNKQLISLYGEGICGPSIPSGDGPAPPTTPSDDHTEDQPIDVVTERERLPELFKAVFDRLRTLQKSCSGKCRQSKSLA